MGQLKEAFQREDGSQLSPLLFSLVLDWIMRSSTVQARNGIQWTPWLQLDDLNFADDLALLTHTRRQMQERTNRVEASSDQIGLNINIGWETNLWKSWRPSTISAVWLTISGVRKRMSKPGLA